MSGEFFTVTMPEQAKKASIQLATRGHVGIDKLYDASLAKDALQDAHKLKIKTQGRNRNPGEYVTPVPVPREVGQHALYLVIEGIKRGARKLGRDIHPHSPREQAHYKLLEVVPDTRGDEHHDHSALVDVVAITNLAGASHLWYEDGTVYDLEPGKTAIHDLARNPLHRGFTDPGQSRTALVLAKIGKS